ncbi:hypothetical protein BJ875DRAFT_369454 [Amylocarpus encephaloides]|uniref:Prolyl 4-hydroxylase alpha subunit domain-containing protein n=1 Tax=Amylocarpus encephaloides TaxID=45428 RepID=A0A9P8C8B0_9HELO|nr:hypothetical protein BJ875DRAFT_369454 [Amylocarpus encephaloides]
MEPLVTYESDEEDVHGKAKLVTYSSIPVDVPSGFLQPLPDPENTLQVQEINWNETALPEYRGFYAVIIDNVLNEQECDELTHLAELSAGAHRGPDSAPNNGWRPAMVATGYGREFLDKEYRNSDRIIWDNQQVIHRIWTRIMQSEKMKNYFSALEGEKYVKLLGDRAVKQKERWVVSEKGPNERMRFLKYGAGQYFRHHCDSRFETPDGEYRSYYTIHVYLNDSEQVHDHLISLDTEPPKDSPDTVLKGGATRFHGYHGYLDADPKIGRVLIFQQRGLWHSGDDVASGVKYTMRSDIMYRLETCSAGEEADEQIVFG